MGPFLVLVLGLQLTSLALLAGASASDHRYKQGDRVLLYANKAGPFHNPSETYSYFDLPSCAPGGGAKVEGLGESLGEALNGDRLVLSAYDLPFLAGIPNATLCNRTLSRRDVARLRQAIKDDFYFQMDCDDLPVWMFFGKFMLLAPEHHVEGVLSQGSPPMLDNEFFLFTHIHFEFHYKGDRVIEVNVVTDSRLFVNITADQEVQVAFTYSASWERTDVPFERRWDKFSRYASLPQHMDLHHFALLSAWSTVVFLACFLLGTLDRTLQDKISKFWRGDAPAVEPTEEQAQQERGWQSIQGEVFTAPPNMELLCAAVGTGTQLLLLSAVILLIGLSGLFYPYNRGTMHTAAVVIYALTSRIAGYAAGALYRHMEGSEWARLIRLTGLLFNGPLLVTFVFLQTVASAYHLTSAVPLWTLGFLLLIWVLFALPLLVVGVTAASRTGAAPQTPTPPAKQARETLALPWYRGTIPQMAMAGILPLGMLWTELSYIFQSLWGFKMYTLYSVLTLLFLALVIATALVSAALTRFQLAAKDHRWWWRSFLCGGSMGIYVFGYSLYYYHVRTSMTGFMQAAFYFGFMACASFAFFLMLGAAGFWASFALVHLMYRSHTLTTSRHGATSAITIPLLPLTAEQRSADESTTVGAGSDPSDTEKGRASIAPAATNSTAGAGASG